MRPSCKLETSIENYLYCQTPKYYDNFIDEKINPLIKERAKLGYVDLKIKKDNLPNSPQAIQFLRKSLFKNSENSLSKNLVCEFVITELQDEIRISWGNPTYQIFKMYQRGWDGYNYSMGQAFPEAQLKKFTNEKIFKHFKRQCRELKNRFDRINSIIANGYWSRK